MLVRVIDLCGREAPYIIDLSSLELPDDAVDHILNMLAEEHSAYLGEIEYQEVTESEANA